ASAQNNSETLVGLTNSPLLPSSSSVDMQVPSFTNCTAATQIGFPLLNNTNSMAGGSAYDPRHKAVWLCDSRLIILYRLSDKKTLCSFTPKLQLSTAAFRSVVSGLAFSPSRRELYQVETIPNAMAITVYNVSTVTNCNPAWKNLGRATLGITGEQCGGLAFDEARSLFYYVTTWAGFAGPGNSIYAATYANPYKMTTNAVSPCSRGSTMTGAAYSNCSRFLYVATASEVNVVRMDDALNGKTTNMNQLLKVSCCQKQKGSGWAGLGLIPAWKKKIVGTSCLSTACATCNSMKLDLGGGDAALGNPDLALTITGAPSGSTGAFYIALGSCTQGTALLGLCGQVYPVIQPPFPMLLGVFNLGGSGTCGGSLNMKLGGVPTSASLCGATACTQFLIRCPQGGLAAGLTNGLEFSIGG
ncbi:MAG: hypothetical protein ACYTF5_07940, partial [Planctomycetota bacterium]